MLLQNRKLLLTVLSQTVESVVKTYEGFSNYHFRIDDQRTAKDVLAHIVFWHENFSSNTFNVSHNIAPKPLTGSYAKLSEQCKNEMEYTSVTQLISRLITSQKIIQENIVKRNIEKIPYRRGSREYTPEEYLDVVNQHLLGHLKEVKDCYEKSTHFLSHG